MDVLYRAKMSTKLTNSVSISRASAVSRNMAQNLSVIMDDFIMYHQIFDEHMKMLQSLKNCHLNV
jgi:hypothetical protein